jgi:hypothetical protein
MPRKSRRRSRRVRGTKRIRGSRRVNRVRRFRISRGGDLWQEAKEKALQLASNVQTGVSNLANQATSAVKGNEEPKQN